MPIINGAPDPAQVVPGTLALGGVLLFEGVSCASVTICEVVGSSGAQGVSGVVVTVTNGVPGTAQVVGDALDLHGVSCPSVATCEAVGESDLGRGAVVPITNGTAGADVVVPGTDNFNAVACSAPTTCQVVGMSDNTGVVVPVTSGIPGAAMQVSGTEQLLDVACISDTTCEAVGDTTTLVPGHGVVLTITTAIPTMVVTLAATGSQTVGSSHPMFSSTTTSPPGDAISGTLSCTSVGNPPATISPTLPAGTYTVQGPSCSGLSLIGPTASNYEIVYQGGAFVVNPSSVTTTTSTTTAALTTTTTSMATTTTVTNASTSSTTTDESLPLTGRDAASSLAAAACLLAIAFAARQLRRKIDR